MLLQYYSVLQSITPVLSPYDKVLLQYYNVLLHYYSVLQCNTPVLFRTTKYYSSTTTPVLLLQYYSSTTKYYASTIPYYKVLLQYYAVLQSTIPVLLRTIPAAAPAAAAPAPAPAPAARAAPAPAQHQHQHQRQHQHQQHQDQHQLEQETNRRITTVSRDLHAQFYERVAPSTARSQFYYSFARSTRPILRKGCTQHRKIAILPQFRAIDTYDLTKGFIGLRRDRNFTTVSRDRHARSYERVHPAPARLQFYDSFARSTRTILREGCISASIFRTMAAPPSK